MLIFQREKNPILSKLGCPSWHPYTDLPRPSGGEKEAKKIEMATILGAEKKGSDLTRQEEKMTNAPVRTAASDPGTLVNTRQKRRKSN